MSQMTVADLRAAMTGVPDDTPVYFRRIAPICGNIEAAGAAALDEASAFGSVFPCIIIEPMQDE